MMEVFEFEKSLLVRLQEAQDILGARDIPVSASGVRNEWANYMEVALEPTGWQALWRIPRVVCEELSVKFPTVVMGTVEQVLFDELKAIFSINAVQDDDVHLPDKQIVSLEELWPLKEQENDCLNIDRTADCVDQLRFFYQHIWMPWDNDDDSDGSDWAEKHLESRIKFYYDLKNKTMSKRLSSHILALLAEANYIQKKRELLEKEIEQEEEDKEDAEEYGLPHPTKACELMEIHLRLCSIKNDVDILENPAMRGVYEKIRFSDEGVSFESKPINAVDVRIVTHVGTLQEQIEYLEKVKQQVDDQQKLVRICDTLQGALESSKSSDQIFLPPGRHSINFLEYLSNGGSIKAISPVPFVFINPNQLLFIEATAAVNSKNDDSILITIDGDYCFENILLDCANVRTGMLIKSGNVTFQNCYFAGDKKSTTKQGIVIFGNSTIQFERCVIKDFAAGIYSNQNCKIKLVDSVIRDCINGIEVLDGCSVNFCRSKIINSLNYGVTLEVNDLQNFEKGETRRIYRDYDSVDRPEFAFEGPCEFTGNTKANFVVFHGSDAAFNNSCYADETSVNENVSFDGGDQSNNN
ncbi:protein nessun dorma isoform X2 [Wyeomyia smithii]|uniref:protein nessun dorma isoform X2 n=1 Tax=Wyeomyia smithii TaxID=174621 RepID=UPI002467AEAC|nr:protein nessun dorma isoform X2 [Wyeomyia smithii]